ncbi:Ubiquitin-conjugating enzyme E2 10 [Oopsacas minuta]|uniref:Ubiquitin-conjugating enzyme E2 10 n=1 Tax=Oopsacas minuta TaxID=111878 RepID=A0AAV7JT69_9METZ|nr:Ubiquitin-conjugating enzyme E2 10 [Oopsacas minuta]
MVSTAAQLRLLQEFRAIQSDSLVNILACPFSAKNLSHWNVRLNGPPDTPYQGGIFFLTMIFPNTYPLEPPHVKFNTKIFHCNINSEGRVCTQLMENWLVTTNISQILLEIYCVLIECNPNNPLVQEFADLYIANRPQYDANARDWTTKYATNS